MRKHRIVTLTRRFHTRHTRIHSSAISDQSMQQKDSDQHRSFRLLLLIGLQLRNPLSENPHQLLLLVQPRHELRPLH
jgi:hypothetical protein